MALKCIERLKEHFKESIISTHSFRGDETASVDPKKWYEICKFLYQDKECLFDMFIDLTCVDYIYEKPRFEIVLHLRSTKKNHRLRLKTRVEEEVPELDSIVSIWPGANWFEREVWDMYGVRFKNHPNLERILLYKEFKGHPLRKDYPIEKACPLTEILEIPETCKGD
jgi:NADH-quinone oxidoreductase subunit C